jgi:hypothetical protein
MLALRINFDLDDDLIVNAMRHSGAKTIHEVV